MKLNRRNVGPNIGNVDVAKKIVFPVFFPIILITFDLQLVKCFRLLRSYSAKQGLQKFILHLLFSQ